jgi:hypothetical protein
MVHCYSWLVSLLAAFVTIAFQTAGISSGGTSAHHDENIATHETAVTLPLKFDQVRSHSSNIAFRNYYQGALTYNSCDGINT